MDQCSPPVELTTYRTTIMRSGFSAPLGVNKRGVSSHHRREGVSAHPVYLNLCSPFLDIGAACPPPTLTAHHSIIATHVAPVCNGWNHRPAASLGCYQYVNERLLAEDDGFEPPPRLAVLPALSTFPLGQSSIYVYPDFSLARFIVPFQKPANLAAGWII